MKELDILLEPFVAQHADAIAQGDWPELETMLDAEDDVLWDWIQNPGTATNPAFRGILERIRRKDA
jgi:succinate dehydrogenase flavin-adding protein (antitoxin of CptAB toxin-antitoxin module)